MTGITPWPELPRVTLAILAEFMATISERPGSVPNLGLRIQNTTWVVTTAKEAELLSTYKKEG